MDKRCNCLAIAEARRRHPTYLPQVSGDQEAEGGGLITDVDTLKRTVDTMVTAASYYKNWEKVLGTHGVALVLGAVAPETS